MDRPAAEIQTASACVPNIGPTGRRLRYIGAGVALALALTGAVRVALLRLPAFEMFGPGLAFFAASFGYFQARGKT